MELKDRLKPTDRRQGKLVKLADALHAMVEIFHSEDFLLHSKEPGYMDIQYNPEAVEKLTEIIRELHSWDITEIGNLYLTSGGRVVLDKGYGECFGEGDTVIFTKEELHSGVKLEEFLKRIGQITNNKR